MKIQLLISTMNRNDFSVLDGMNLQSSAVVINQCGKVDRKPVEYNGQEIIWIDSAERGVSRSRNLALSNSDADICVLCDDDECLSDGYVQMIERAYMNLPEADFIVFNIDRISWNETETTFTKPKRIGNFRTYGSVHITFRREAVVNKHIRFDVRFGTGSGMYSCAEDALFCVDCHKAGLRMYTYPGILCKVSCGSSSWFHGYDEEYFYNTGAYLSAAFPTLRHIMKWYYPIRCRKISNLGIKAIIGSIDDGMRGYKKGMNYQQYHNAVLIRSNEG